jgi:CspA family cold shock protein
MKGTVKWFSVNKGYGFITGEDGKDIFVHYSSIEVEGFKTLNEGQEVTYEIGEGTNKRPVAVNVKPV